MFSYALATARTYETNRFKIKHVCVVCVFTVIASWSFDHKFVLKQTDSTELKIRNAQKTRCRKKD